MRGGFVLPLSLVATFVTLLIVGGSASYCSTMMRTSESYTARTRCRLAAQSAIEAAKLRLKADAGPLIADVTSANYATTWSELFESLKSADALREVLQCVADKGCKIDVNYYAPTNNVVAIRVTASLAAHGQNTSVTLQECVKMTRSDLNVFLYAYFANGDGHLISKYLTVNGDVRANGDFLLSGAEINGYVYAGKNAVIEDENNTSIIRDLINSALDWEGKITICPKSTYNSNYRSNSGNVYYSYYSPVRPTNPLNKGTSWAGGFETADERKGLGGRFLNFLGYDTREVTRETKSIAPFDKHIINDQVGPLEMPRITDESGSDIDAYKNYAKNALVRRVGGASQTGGSLTCLNCWYDGDGTIKEENARQHSMEVRLYCQTGLKKIVTQKQETRTISASDWYKNHQGEEGWSKVQGDWVLYTTWKKLNGYERMEDGSLLGGGHRAEYSKFFAEVSHQEPVYGNKFVKRELRRIKVVGGNVIDNTVEIDGCREISGETDNICPFRKLINHEIQLLNDLGVETAKQTFDTYVTVTDDEMKKYANVEDKSNPLSMEKGSVILIGTWDAPIEINGPVVFPGDVLIRGYVTGRGTIYSGRNIHIIGDIVYKDPPRWPLASAEPNTKEKDMLALVSKGSIVIGNYVVDGLWMGKDAITGDTMSKSILKGNFINGNVNSTAGRAYTAVNYTDYDESKYQKIVLSKSGSSYVFTKDRVKRYESVLGDYLFMATDYRNEFASGLSGSGLLSQRGLYLAKYPGQGLSEDKYLNADCVCRFSQYWDLNFGHFSLTLADEERETYKKYAVYHAKPIDAYISAQRNDALRKSWHFTNIWEKDFWDTCDDKFAINNASVNNSSKPLISDILLIDAVLYSSAGIFGVIGSYKGECAINGAVIAQEEALIPICRRAFEHPVNLVLNWDIRLNPSSEDAKRDALLTMGLPEMTKKTKTSSDLIPRTISWQEVPADFAKP